MTDHQWDIVVVGGINTDYTARGEALPGPGDSNRGDRFLISQGGKGANQAVAAARLGARVAVVGRIGEDDRGDEALKNFKSEGVGTEFLIRDSERSTGAAVIQVDQSGEKQILAVPNANQGVAAADIRNASAIRQCKVLLCPLEVPLEALQEAVKLGYNAGAAVVLDPSPPKELPDDFLQQVTLIKPNRGEAKALTGIEVTDRASARQAAQQLLERGVEAVAVQAGGEGNLLVWNGGEVWLPKIDVESVDATGAGDAFAAAIAVCLAEGKSWEEAGWIASAAAALTTTEFGAQGPMPTRAAVERLLAEKGPNRE